MTRFFKSAALAGSVLLAAVVFARAGDYDHHAVIPEAMHIMVTINPEARVTAQIVSPPSPADRCGDSVTLPFSIRNEAHVTAPLVAELAIPTPGVHVDRDSAPLSGKLTERRVVRLTQRDPGSRDVTLRFSLSDGTEDPDGRASVHLLLRCQAS